MSIKGPDNFQIKNIIGSPSKHKVMTSLPTPESISALKPLRAAAPQLFARILNGLKLVYSYVTDRNYQEGTVTFFHHAGGPALYEKHYRTKINGKDHGKKLGTIFPVLNSTLKEIEVAIADPALKDHEKGLLDFQAEYIWQINIFILVIKSLSPEIQTHLKNHCNIESDKLKEIIASPGKRERISRIHPMSPTRPHTPKKLSIKDRLAISAIQNNGSPVKPTRNIMAEFASSVDEKAIVKMVPRNLKVIKKPITPQFEKQLLLTSTIVEAQEHNPVAPSETKVKLI